MNRLKLLPKPYWSNTSSNNIIKTLIEKSDVQIRNKIEELIDGGVMKSAVHEDITYADIDKSEESLWNFLYFTGYLKSVSEKLVNGQLYVEMKIPNAEVSYIYKNKITEWMQEKIRKTDLSRFYQSMLNGDYEVFEEELAHQLRDCISFYDAKEALNQIERKHYARELERDGYENIIWYGIGFYKKIVV